MKSLIVFAFALVGAVPEVEDQNESGLLTYERVLNAHRYCQRLCQLTPSCRNDTHAHGSYCKLWQSVPVCFGLYRLPHYPLRGAEDNFEGDAIVDEEEIGREREEEEEGGRHHRVRYCFQPFSRKCDDSKLKPVKCGFFPPRRA